MLTSLFPHSRFFKGRIERFAPVAHYKRATSSLKTNSQPCTHKNFYVQTFFPYKEPSPGAEEYTVYCIEPRVIIYRAAKPTPRKLCYLKWSFNLWRIFLSTIYSSSPPSLCLVLGKWLEMLCVICAAQWLTNQSAIGESRVLELQKITDKKVSNSFYILWQY